MVTWGIPSNSRSLFSKPWDPDQQDFGGKIIGISHRMGYTGWYIYIYVYWYLKLGISWYIRSFVGYTPNKCPFSNFCEDRNRNWNSYCGGKCHGLLDVMCRPNEKNPNDVIMGEEKLMVNHLAWSDHIYINIYIELYIYWIICIYIIIYTIAYIYIYIYTSPIPCRLWSEGTR